MTPLLLSLVGNLVRVWTRIYTWRLSPAIREARRAEIESDLWEFEHDADVDQPSALHLLSRLLGGIPDDLLWRVEYATQARPSARMAVAITAIAAAVFSGVFWFYVQLLPVALPTPPRGLAFVASPPPPPPLPPPPPPPPPLSR